MSIKYFNRGHGYIYIETNLSGTLRVMTELMAHSVFIHVHSR